MPRGNTDRDRIEQINVGSEPVSPCELRESAQTMRAAERRLQIQTRRRPLSNVLTNFTMR